MKQAYAGAAALAPCAARCRAARVACSGAVKTSSGDPTQASRKMSVLHRADAAVGRKSGDCRCFSHAHLLLRYLSQPRKLGTALAQALNQET